MTSATGLFFLPDLTLPFIQNLLGLKKIFEYHSTLCTFILAFFTSQAFSYWQQVYTTTRMIQGRINDYCMLLVLAAERGDDKTNYSEPARELVKTCTRLVRMSHIFFWASMPTASNGLNDCERFLVDAENCPLPVDDEHIGPLLLSPFGLKALINSGQLTKQEVENLEKTGLPPSQYAYVLLVWAGLYTMDGLKQGLLRGGAGMEENLLRQLTTLRASMVSEALLSVSV
jgi:hypothetical protein